MFKTFAAAALVAVASAQQVGTQKQEYHLPLTYQTCTKAGGCQDQRGEVVLDANWRWTHNVGGYTNCYTGTEWDRSFCPDNKTCAEKCALEGVDENTWRNTYGVTTEGNKLRLNYVTG